MLTAVLPQKLVSPCQAFGMPYSSRISWNKLFGPKTSIWRGSISVVSNNGRAPRFTKRGFMLRIKSSYCAKCVSAALCRLSKSAISVSDLRAIASGCLPSLKLNPRPGAIRASISGEGPYPADQTINDGFISVSSSRLGSVRKPTSITDSGNGGSLTHRR